MTNRWWPGLPRHARPRVLERAEVCGRTTVSCPQWIACAVRWWLC